jgi:hypothetical protein
MPVSDPESLIHGARRPGEFTAKQGIPSKSIKLEQEFARLTHTRDTHARSLLIAQLVHHKMALAPPAEIDRDSSGPLRPNLIQERTDQPLLMLATEAN